MSTATCMARMIHGTWHFCDERMTKFMLFNTTVNILEILTNSFSTISAHSYNYFYRYGMSLKQILYDNILIIEINTTFWEIGLIFFREHMKCWYHWYRVLLIWSILFNFFPNGSEDSIWHVVHWSVVYTSLFVICVISTCTSYHFIVIVTEHKNKSNTN